MPKMTWFWRLVCSPECDEACQTNCPGCQAMAPEWERQGQVSPYVDASTPVRWRWARAYQLWRCWSRSASARMLARLNPVRRRSGAAVPAAACQLPVAGQAGCGCEPAPVQQAGCGCEPGCEPAAVKQEVQRHYGVQAAGILAGGDGCCDPALPDEIRCTSTYSAEELERLPAEALLASLGCGNPLARAELRPGEVVLDLGAGGGMDAFVAAGRVAPDGKVIALDMSDEMLALARANAAKLGATNVELLKGDMEAIPLPDGCVDVIISNCVVNLAPDKRLALGEALRVLRPGGRLTISDVVTREPVPAVLKGDLGAWAACIGGALSEQEYREHLAAAGFVDVVVERDREYTARDAELAGLDSLLQGGGLELMTQLGFASASIRARKAGATTHPATVSRKESSGVD